MLGGDDLTVHERAFRDYSNGVKYKDIAAKYGVSLDTVKSWKRRYGWSRDSSSKSVHTNKKVCTQKKVGAPLGNKNSLGHGGTTGNQNAVIHGLFSKYLPQETLELVTDLEEANPLDILWANIKIKFAAIIRAQNIMFVRDQNDHTILKEKRGVIEDGVDGRKTTIVNSERVVSAAEKSVAFLNAQSRAMGPLTNMIKQYDEMCRSSLATEEQVARIDKIRAEINALSSRREAVVDAEALPIIVEDIPDEQG